MEEDYNVLVGNNQYLSMLDIIPNPVYYVDGNFTYTYANPEYEKWMNVPEGTVVGKQIYEVPGDEIYNKISSYVTAALRGEAVEFEMEADLPGREHSVIKAVYTPQISSTGTVSGYLAMLYDVTEKRQGERKLKQSELQFKQLVYGLEAAVYICDKDGYITMYNDAAVELWGRTPVIGKDAWCGSWKIYNTDGTELPLDSCPMSVTLKTGKPVYNAEIIVERPDGRKLRVRPHPRPLFDEHGEIIGAVNMLLDVTDQVKTENDLREVEKEIRRLNVSLEHKVLERTRDLVKKNLELHESEERYHRMIEEVEDYAIILMDKDGYIQNWNKGAEKIKGYKEEEIIGKNFRIFYLPEDRASGLPDKLIAEATNNGRAVHEGWRLTKDGKKFWGSIVITALHDEQNNITGFTKLTRNLTERKLAEDKLRQSAADLEAQNKELEQFAYIASHDMKEPLRKIMLYNNMISLRAADQLGDKEKTLLERSHNAALRMQRLIDDLLAYSKTSFHNDKYEVVDLNEVLGEITEFYKEGLEEAKGSISMAELPVINGIGFQLRQLFDNLVSNAIKYKSADRDLHIDITCEKMNATELPVRPERGVSDYYRITFTDNGIGFSKKYSQKIFELFQRLSTKDEYSGNGIGLSICKRIVQNHDGFIEATGHENEGATFNIFLPMPATA